jgi:hypothetical protein
MASFNELKRRSVLPLAGAAVAAYYLLVFVPLANRARSVDAPLQKAWQKLATSLDQTNATTLDFGQITNQLNETRQELALVEDARKKAAAHLESAAELRAKLSAPFQLVDYQNERSRQIDGLDRQAKKEKISVDPVVFAGFPEHTADMMDPSLLWAALALTDELLETAVKCKVAAIHSLEVAINTTNPAPSEVTGRWAEIPLQLEFTASADNAIKVIQSLPLRAEEIKAAGLPATSPQKTPLFIDRLIIRKESPDKVDEARVYIRAIGFVLRD